MRLNVHQDSRTDPDSGSYESFLPTALAFERWPLAIVNLFFAERRERD